MTPARRAEIRAYIARLDQLPGWTVEQRIIADLYETLGESIDEQHLNRQREWSLATFGPGHRTGGVLDHIRKEIVEIEQNPADLFEWVDVIILALDGAWRAGYEPWEIIRAVKVKQTKNEQRIWPDRRTQSQDIAIEHLTEPPANPYRDGEQQ